MNMRFLGALGLVFALTLPAVASAQTVEIHTNKGTIRVVLDAEKAPISVKNFLTYAGEGFYNGTIFHRVIKGFMIQGGGFGTDFQKKTTKAPIKLEAGNGLSNKRGTIAMARTAVKDSATSQFFINHADNARLDSYGGGYAVFGKVTRGMDVVDQIANIATHRAHGQPNLPIEDVIITDVKILKK